MSRIFSIICLVSVLSFVNAQNKKEYFDINWDKTTKEKASFYSVKSIVKNKNGKFEVRDYFIEGRLQMVGEYADKNYKTKDGSFQYFYFNGAKSSTKKYRNNQLQGEYIAYYPNGNIEIKGYYSYDVKDRQWQEFYEDGIIKSVTIYSNNGRDGTYQSFYRNRQIKEQGYLLNDSRNGDWTKNHNNGRLDYSGTYSNNQRSGNWKFYHDNGKISAKVTFVNGALSTQVYYDREGKVSNISKANRKPSFKGGGAALKTYIEKNLREPILVKERGIKGQVFVSFYVEIDGSLSNVKIEKSLHPKIDNSVLKLINEMPIWVPGKLYNREQPIQDVLAISIGKNN